MKKLRKRSIVAIRELEFRYANGEYSLRIPELTIAEGEKLFLYGPSGSGKSTLLSLIAGILIPQHGTINVLDRDLKTMSSKERDRFRGEHLSIIFQEFNLLPFLSVRDNVRLPLDLFPSRMGPATKIGQTPDAHIVAKSDDAKGVLCDLMLQRLGLSDIAHRKASDISRGQAQRAAAARALIGRPNLILADEPTSSLDTDATESFLATLFKQMQQSRTALIFVSHDRSLKKRFDRAVDLTSLISSQTRNV
jgi:putative ABC transport system ATP-binding protein